MKYLVIDAGNTTIKLAVFEEETVIWKDTMSVFSLITLERIVAEHNPEASVLSSVIHLDPEVISFMGLLPNAIFLDASTPLPFKNNYATPETLGRDRLANVAGAVKLFPGSNVLVIDAGTCIKFDFITRDGVYSGGAISPGLQMRYEALHSFTDQLPLLAPTEETPLIGNSTAASIHSGIVNGMVAEIEGIAASYLKQFANLRLILTGGDSRYFLNHLKKPIFADPELTLKGLHFILLHNCTQ